MPKLDEARIREIVREEIIKWHREAFVPMISQTNKRPKRKTILQQKP